MPLLLMALLVLVDPGHDPVHFGATSARGVPEVQYNDRMASVVAARLAKVPGLRVERTRRDDQQMTARERGLLANRRQAALLLSLHHDAVHDEDERTWIFDGKQERYSEAGRGFSLHVRGDRPVAVRIARAIARELVKNGFRPTTYHANEFPVLDAKLGIYDRRHLAMLNAAKVPAVLLECGFIDNRDEELELRRPEVRARIAEAIVRALRRLPKLLKSPAPAAHR